MEYQSDLFRTLDLFVWQDRRGDILSSCRSRAGNRTIEDEAGRIREGKLIVPSDPVIPFITGDGVGTDITPVMQRVVDVAVMRAYDKKRSLKWMKRARGSCWETMPADCSGYSSGSA
jgi:hypothetical protein